METANSSDSPKLREDLNLSRAHHTASLLPLPAGVSDHEVHFPEVALINCLLPLNHLCSCKNHKKQCVVKGWPECISVSSLTHNSH